MTILRFRDICDVIPGTYLAKKDYSETGCFSVQGAGSEMGTHDEPNFRYAITVIGKVGTVGKPRYFPNGCWVNNNAAAVVAKNGIIDPFILNLILNMIDWSKFRAQTAQPFLLINDFLDYEFRVDGIGFRDQEKTSSSMKEYDAKLTALREKADGLRQFKTGLMQRLFSQELRFTREDGSEFPEWEEWKLGAVATFYKGKGVSKADIEDGGATPCIRYGEIYTRYSERITEIASATNVDPDDLFLSEAGDVIIPASGEDRLDMARACCVTMSDVALGGDINVLRAPIRGDFLAYYLNATRKKEIAMLGQGNSVVHLYPDHLRTLTVEIPHPDEQSKIADALMTVEAKIATVTDQITQMETFKKGLLQKLFA